jgi:drug/metabolite transporter (DMT)-like permease
MYTVVTLPSIGGILFLGIFQLGISYILYTKAVKQVSAIDAVLIPIIEPLFNPLWVFMATGEHPSILAVYGGIIVLATIIFRSLYLIRLSSIKPQRTS